MLNDVELVFTGDQKKHHLLKKKNTCISIMEEKNYLQYTISCMY